MRGRARCLKTKRRGVTQIEDTGGLDWEDWSERNCGLRRNGRGCAETDAQKLRTVPTTRSKMGSREAMEGYVRSIEKVARQNATFRTVVHGEELPTRRDEP